MTFTKVLAVVPVADFEGALGWYERLLGRAPEARPMDGLADWHVTESAWIQVYRDEERAGAGTVNLVVRDIAASVSELAARGIDVGDITTTEKGARPRPVTDPDGNTATLIENPSV